MIKVRVIRGKNADVLAERMNEDREDRFASQIHVEPSSGDMVAFLFYESGSKRSSLDKGKPATENQIWRMKKEKIDFPENCTKDQAHDLLDKFFEGKQ